MARHPYFNWTLLAVSVLLTCGPAAAAEPPTDPAVAPQPVETRENPELKRIHAEDQADRGATGGKIDGQNLGARDELRRRQVDAILAAGGATVSADYFHAAMVYQHGTTPEHIQRAHDLALKAVELEPENAQARWLVASSEDRKLMYEKKPQKWGTQFHRVGDQWRLWEVEASTTDEERAKWNVPPLAEAHARAARMNAALPKP